LSGRRTFNNQFGAEVPSIVSVIWPSIAAGISNIAGKGQQFGIRNGFATF